MLSHLTGLGLVAMTRILVGARAQYHAPPAQGQCVYFANHTSHLDTLAIWSALPPDQRKHTRPVAARAYWGKPGLRQYLAGPVLNTVLIDRNRESSIDPLVPVIEALDQGSSLIFFPEGTRNSERLPQPFKGGLYRLAQQFSHVNFIPVYLDTLHRSLPKGSLVPIPLPIYCNVNFGPAINLGEQTREDFLSQARLSVEAMA